MPAPRASWTESSFRRLSCTLWVTSSSHPHRTLTVTFACADKYQEALQLIDGHTELGEMLVFERSYCLYQLNREAESLATLELLGDDGGSRADLLAAQILYRQGRYDRATERFMRVAKGNDTPSYAELSTNLLAALISAGRAAEALEYASSLNKSDQFELFYNRSCAAIEISDLEAARLLLQKALRACRESLPVDEYTEEEIEVELGALTAQAAYVDQQLGDHQSAFEAYESLFSFKSDLDPVIAAVAANNMVALRSGAANLFDSWKKCRATLADALVRKLMPRQRRTFLSNATLLSLHMSKIDQCKELLQTLDNEFATSAEVLLLKAALASRAKQPVECERLLREVTCGEGGTAAATDQRASITLAQLQLQAKDPERALETLLTIESLHWRPAMVGTLVALHEQLGQVEQAASVLAAAPSEVMIHIGATFFARHGRWGEAVVARRKLITSSPSDIHALAGLVIALSHVDVEEANEHLSRLELLSGRAAAAEATEYDSELLERSGLPCAKRGDVDERAAKRMAGVDDAAAARPLNKKRRARKKPLYAKGCFPEIAGTQPDPERWLPKRERSTYRQRKKDKRGGLSRGPQGSTAGAADVKARTTTNVKALSSEQKNRTKQEEEIRAKSQVVAAAVVAAGGGKRKAKTKSKW